jgi:hypothetical protein
VNRAIAARLAELKPIVEARLKEGAEKIAQVVESKISDGLDRLMTYAIDYAKLCQLQHLRATDPEHQDVRGLQTGLLAVTCEMVGKTLYKVAKYDSAIERDKLAIKKQYAIELQEWSEKVDHKFDSVEWLKTAKSPEKADPSPRPLWTCPQCGGPMVLIERVNPLELRLRSPPVPIARRP